MPYRAAMSAESAQVDLSNKTVNFNGTEYKVQTLADDQYTVLLAGVPVGRIVFSFGAPNGVPEGDAISEDDLYAIGEAWFAALEAQ
jgi:hypothetical protein